MCLIQFFSLFIDTAGGYNSSQEVSSQADGDSEEEAMDSNKDSRISGLHHDITMTI